ncbi:cellulose biosynthesis cyclic di-GMP-binding regulatory protein BcsB [Mariprofundus ferrooxydans]|nr:cellulose biosynthesis cyclic di-GMP-binding regulatory protein BcsB [Mariprofundus ferrooxydans]
MRQGLFFASLFLIVSLFTVPLVNADIGDRLEVSASKTALHAGPSATAVRLMRLSEGAQMVEMERQGGWLFVSLKGSGAQGWIQASVVRKVMHRVIENKAQKHVKKQKKRKTSKHKSTVTTLAEPAVPAMDSNYSTRKTSLKDIGLPKGILFEGALGVHSKTFYFPAPLDSLITHGSFRLLFRASPNLLALADVRIAINDIPYKQINIPSDGGMHAVDVQLPSTAFKGGLVKVTVNSGLPLTENRCFDARLSDVFLHIFPESSLSIAYRSVEKSIRDAWRMLPHNVTISLSAGRLGEGQFASALAMMSLLVDSGKEVKITRLPEMGDIIIAPKSVVEPLVRKLNMEAKQPEMNESLNHVSNLALAHFSNRTAIVVLDPYDVQPIYLLDDSWAMLAASDHYRISRPDNIFTHVEMTGTEGESGYFSLPLSKLGMDISTKSITTEVSWQTVINPFDLPVGTQPEFINLNIVAPVRWENDPTYELYVFLNDILVKSARLDNSGAKQHFTVNLPSEYQRQYNFIRIVVQHDVVSGNCEGILPTDFVQITPDTALVVKESSSDTPEKFSDLAKYFLGGFDTYMESEYLDQPEQILHLMSRLAADFPLMINHAQLHFVASGSAIQPKGPFVAMGRFTLGDDIEAPVRFDQGRVKIVAPNGESYFDVDQLDKVTIAQVVRAPNGYGLWVTPSNADDLSKIEHLKLAEDDVAFIDSYGVVKTLDSSEPTLAEVYYPDVEDWFDVLGKYRFWLMVLLWFLLTLIVVYLYRMSRMNKLAREDDDAMYQDAENEMQGSKAVGMHEDHTVHSGAELDHLDEKR